MSVVRYENKSLPYQFFWIFIIGCVLGDIIETIYCFLVTGTIMSRTSVLYGPFSLVWGTGAVIMSVLTEIILRIENKKSLRFTFLFLFLIGSIAGSAHEYIFSYISEYAFGVIHWDYSDMPFNLDGRINLLFSIFWGIIAAVWIRHLYPHIRSLLSSVSWSLAKTTTFAMAIFIILDIYITASAMVRYTERHRHIPAVSSYERYLDQTYPDAVFANRFPELDFAE